MLSSPNRIYLTIHSTVLTSTPVLSIKSVNPVTEGTFCQFRYNRRRCWPLWAHHRHASIAGLHQQHPLREAQQHENDQARHEVPRPARGSVRPPDDWQDGVLAALRCVGAAGVVLSFPGVERKSDLADVIISKRAIRHKSAPVALS